MLPVVHLARTLKIQEVVGYLRSTVWLECLLCVSTVGSKRL